MESLPIISIITATFNRAHFILETLYSIQNQTFQEWECLIIDDGGTDNTYETILPILEIDKRFKFLKRPYEYSKGLPGCRNYGLDIAKGNYFVFFDDDDIIHPNNLELALETIIKNNVDFCHYSKQPFHNEIPLFEKQIVTNNSDISKRDIYEIVTNKIGLASCTVLWKKKCFANLRFIEQLQYAEEWECYIRIILNEFRGKSIKNVLYFNRKHINSNTGEYYLNNPLRKKSHFDAIILVVKNLKKNNLITSSIIRYFLQLSLNFKEYGLFQLIVTILNFNFIEKLKWNFFYYILPIKLFIYKQKKKLK